MPEAFDQPPVVEYETRPTLSNGRVIANMAAVCAVMPLPLFLLLGLHDFSFASIVIPMVLALPVGGLVLGVIAAIMNRKIERSSNRRARFAAFLSLMILSIEMVVAISLSGSGRPRAQALRVRCASNMRQIGLGLLMYANEYNNQFPPTLDPLLTVEELSSDVFVCPSSADQPGQFSYIYLGAGKTNAATSDTVLLYEKPGHHKEVKGGGMNVLYGDGHVEWLERKEAKRVIAELESGHNPPRPEGKDR